jgi:hypothetical protein
MGGSGIEAQFRKMGVRVRVQGVPLRAGGGGQFTRGRWRSFTLPAAPLRVDVRRDGAGEYFDLAYRKDVELSVADVRPADRHLLLVARTPADGQGGGRAAREAFLCGHDERHWFVAAIPEKAGAYDVQAAKDALKPPAVWEAMAEHGVSKDQRDRRRTRAFVRQGEWFFIPRPRLQVVERLVLANEPIQRGGGKPHLCQYLYRTQGEQVYVCGQYPNGVTADQYHALPKFERRTFKWRRMVRDANVFVRGTVRHGDHKTLVLEGWHQVVMNTETQARAMRHVAFLD